MLIKNIYVHVVYNCSVCNGVKSCLNIDNAKLGELWSGGCLNKSHGGCEFLFFCTIFHSVLQICCAQVLSPVGVGLVVPCAPSAHCRGTRAALT